MTCGIYKLVFENTNKVYIGQSIHIEVRFKEHLRNAISKNTSEKLLEAFTTYGSPTLEVLCECSKVDLDIFEKETIEIYDSVTNGFNTLLDTYSPRKLSGESHPNSIYTNEQIETVFFLLVANPSMCLAEISSISCVSRVLVVSISSLNGHKWLKDKYPQEYTLLESLKNTRTSSAYSRGKVYPSIQSPDGTVYSNIPNATKFAKEFNLSPGNLIGVLNGKRYTHKGWKLYKENLP